MNKLDELSIIPADPAAHFAGIARLMSGVETEPTTADSLAEWYEKQLSDGIRLSVAVTPAGELLGFNGIYRLASYIEGAFGIYVVVDGDFQGLGIGGLLYDHILEQTGDLKAGTLQSWVRDDSQAGLRFAKKRGFVLKNHSIGMMLNLDEWDEEKYKPILESLQGQGFCFTNMAEQGDTAIARRKLYELNNNAAATDPGAHGVAPWASFEKFEQFVCSSYWYHPDAQFVAIDTLTGEWAAMSAITVFSGADHAYNLFTGVDLRYRGRKLAQAVKSLALRRARGFGVHSVRTSHSAENPAMIAIDEKLGYVRTPGTYLMEKELES